MTEIMARCFLYLCIDTETCEITAVRTSSSHPSQHKQAGGAMYSAPLFHVLAETHGHDFTSAQKLAIAQYEAWYPGFARKFPLS